MSYFPGVSTLNVEDTIPWAFILNWIKGETPLSPSVHVLQLSDRGCDQLPHLPAALIVGPQ